MPARGRLSCWLPGGVYTEGSPIRERDIASRYLRLILNVIGITDVTFIAAGGAKAVDLGEIGREDFSASTWDGDALSAEPALRTLAAVDQVSPQTARSHAASRWSVETYAGLSGATAGLRMVKRELRARHRPP